MRHRGKISGNQRNVYMCAREKAGVFLAWRRRRRRREEVILFECIFNYPRLVLLHKKKDTQIFCIEYFVLAIVDQLCTRVSFCASFVRLSVVRQYFPLYLTMLYQLKISIQLRQLHGHVFPIYVIVVIVGVVVPAAVCSEH